MVDVENGGRGTPAITYINISDLTRCRVPSSTLANGLRSTFLEISADLGSSIFFHIFPILLKRTLWKSIVFLTVPES